MLLILFNKLWDKLKSTILLSSYQEVLKQPKVFKDMKNFYICNTFFKNVINTYVVILIIEITNYTDINKFWS